MSRERRLYGHRGLAALPENTLPAFRQALADGANALEMDVHLTRDGAVVVAHDPDGRRRAGVARSILDCTLDEVRGWKVGTLPDGAPTRIPTFDEVLEAFPLTRLNVDLKPTDPAIVAAVTALIRRRSAEQRVTLTSFHDRIVATLLTAGYPGEIGLARNDVLRVRFAPLFWLRRGRWSGRALQIPPALHGLRLDSARFIDRCHALGLRVDYWVINDADEARGLLGRGADGIVTDVPARLAAAVLP